MQNYTFHSITPKHHLYLQDFYTVNIDHPWALSYQF